MPVSAACQNDIFSCDKACAVLSNITWIGHKFEGSSQVYIATYLAN